MRIGEVAEMAGVTVRTIHYYHQRDLLPEAPRRVNGYREYTVDHLIALLRLRQLAELGIPLSQAGSMVLQAGSESSDDLIDEVDRALEVRIADLTAQRERIKAVRSSHHLGLSKLGSALVANSADVPAATLFAHLYQGQSHDEELADAFLEPRFREHVDSLQRRFSSLDDTTSQDEVRSFVADAQALFDGKEYEVPELSAQQQELIWAITERGGLNDRQREVLRALQ